MGLSNLWSIAEHRLLVIAVGGSIFAYDEDSKDCHERVSTHDCASLGFCDEELINVIIEQIHRLSVQPSYSGRTVEPALQLADRLAAFAPSDDAGVVFLITEDEIDEVVRRIESALHTAYNRMQ